MIFRQLFEPRSCTYTYLLGDEATGKAVIIDPVFETFRRDAALVRELGLTLVATLDTHAHADHITGAWLLKQELGSQILLSETAGASGVDRTLSDGDVVQFGELQAWDPASGKKVWSHNFPKSQLFGSVTATAGDLVLVGGTNDRMFRAFHAKTGELLWEQKTNSGIMGMPVAYEVDGTQYIAVQSGWGVDAQRIQDALAKGNTGLEDNVPQGGVVWVFAVKK